MTIQLPVFPVGPLSAPDEGGTLDMPLPVPGGVTGVLHIQPFTLDFSGFVLGEVAELRVF